MSYPRCIALALTALAFATADGQAHDPRMRTTTCHEDERCWVWSTMGNQERAVITVSGRRHIVSPCRYTRLYRAGLIDQWRTKPLRGDRTARHIGCR